MKTIESKNQFTCIYLNSLEILLTYHLRQKFQIVSDVFFFDTKSTLQIFVITTLQVCFFRYKVETEGGVRLTFKYVYVSVSLSQCNTCCKYSVSCVFTLVFNHGCNEGWLGRRWAGQALDTGNRKTNVYTNTSIFKSNYLIIPLVDHISVLCVFFNLGISFPAFKPVPPFFSKQYGLGMWKIIYTIYRHEKETNSYHIHLLVLVFAIGALSSRHQRVETEQEEHVKEQEADDADNDDHNDLWKCWNETNM